jgi:hypothetical protein
MTSELRRNADLPQNIAKTRHEVQRQARLHVTDLFFSQQLSQLPIYLFYKLCRLLLLKYFVNFRRAAALHKFQRCQARLTVS